MVTYGFRGLMAPVFTAFSDDGQHVIYDKILSYGKHLKENNVHGVLVNGSTGEGMCLSVDERFRTAECWRSTCDQYELNMMLQIGGTAICDVWKMAAHAESIRVDAVLCLPELYYKPTSEDALVRYIKNVAKHCPNTPLLYYHFPKMSGVDLNLPRFLELVEAAVPNFVGVKFSSAELDVAQACLKPGRVVFVGAVTVLAGALTLGVDSAIMSVLNICPEHAVRLFQSMKDGHVEGAQREQRALTGRVGAIVQDGDFVGKMKAEFNRMNPNLDAGPCRKPM